MGTRNRFLIIGVASIIRKIKTNDTISSNMMHHKYRNEIPLTFEEAQLKLKKIYESSLNRTFRI